MILRAPAFVYPAELWSFRPEGSFISKSNWVDSVSTEHFVPNLSNYQIGSSGRRLRWMELLPGDASIKIPRNDQAEVAIIDDGNTVLRKIDYTCNSYVGVRKPSFVSMVFYLIKGNDAYWSVWPQDAECNTDMALYPFGKDPRPLNAAECIGYTTRWDPSISKSSNVITMAVGSWAQLQVSSAGLVGALTRFKVSLTAERQCRLYAESIDNLTGNPVVSITGGQTYPTQIKGPGDTDLAASQGGVIINGGNPDVYILTGRDSGAYLTRLRIRADFEVPYDI